MEGGESEGMHKGSEDEGCLGVKRKGTQMDGGVPRGIPRGM